MKDLIQEGRKIQETFKKRVVKEQTLNEGKISDMVKKIINMAKKEVESRHDELAQFFDLDKFRRDNPPVSFSALESDVISALKSIQKGQSNEGIVNEDFSSFFTGIKNNIKSFFTSVNTFIKGLSTFPSVLKLLKYVKDPKGLMKYYSDNMTIDGIRYKGLSKSELSFENIKMNEAGEPDFINIFLAVSGLLMMPCIIIIMLIWDKSDHEIM